MLIGYYQVDERGRVRHREFQISDEPDPHSDARLQAVGGLTAQQVHQALLNAATLLHGHQPIPRPIPRAVLRERQAEVLTALPRVADPGLPTRA